MSKASESAKEADDAYRRLVDGPWQTATENSALAVAAAINADRLARAEQHDALMVMLGLIAPREFNEGSAAFLIFTRAFEAVEARASSPDREGGDEQ